MVWGLVPAGVFAGYARVIDNDLATGREPWLPGTSGLCAFTYADDSFHSTLVCCGRLWAT